MTEGLFCLFYKVTVTHNPKIKTTCCKSNGILFLQWNSLLNLLIIKHASMKNPNKVMLIKVGVKPI